MKMVLQTVAVMKKKLESLTCTCSHLLVKGLTRAGRIQGPSPWGDCLLARGSSGKEEEGAVVEHLIWEEVWRKWLEID